MSALLAAVILMMPWVKLEVFPRIIIADVAFLLLVVIILCRSFVKQEKFRLSVIREDFKLVVAMWLIAVLATGFNIPHPRSFLFEAGGMFYLGTLSIVFATMFARDEEIFQRMIRWLTYSIIIVAIVSLMGIAKVVLTGHHDLFFYSNSAKLIATFKRPNQLAGFLILFLPFAWELFWSGRRRKLRYGVLLIALVAGVLASGSRSGLAGVIFAAGVYFVWYLRKKNIKLVLGSIISTILIIGMIYYVQSHIGAITRAFDVMNIIFSRGQVTDPFRLKNWHTALLIFQRFPFAGYGLGNFCRDFRYEVHNTYLSVLAEMGLVGATALVLLIGYITFMCYQNVLLAAQVSPAWLPYARGLFIGLLTEYVYATQHLMIRSRHLWLVFGLIVAMNSLLRTKCKSMAGKSGRADVRNLRSAKS